jgi:murein DD-endopeptidase MepM/ murein hydrolase activator NlpD
MTQKKNALILFTLLCCLPFFSLAQLENPFKAAMAAKLVKFYNEKKYDSIYSLYSPETKKLLSLPKTREFFDGFYKLAGPIKEYVFIEDLNEFSRYKASCTKGDYWMIFSEHRAMIGALYYMVYDGPAYTGPVQRNKTELALPFKGSWLVFWGGDTKEQNYHVVNKAQKNAFDLIKIDEKGHSYKTNGKTNEDYYAYGQPLYAACDGEIVKVLDGIKENIPGKMNVNQVAGNHIVLKTAANEYILYAHFKTNSIMVKEGDQVKKGQQLGLCGNSGNSSEPHLHFHVMTGPTMDSATGIKAYFEKILVNGEEKKDYSPVKGETIANKD